MFRWTHWTPLVIGLFAFATPQHVGPSVCRAERPRVFVLTDISNEPDDEESLVRFLVYSNEFDVEGLVATTSTWLRSDPREDLIRRQIDAYAKVRDNLSAHAAGYPTADQLRLVTATGQTEYGMAGVGEGKSTPGSELLIDAALMPDQRPLWVCIWGGANTLAQALRDAGRKLRYNQFHQMVRRLRVYTISDQDDAGPWLRREFADLFYIVSPSTEDGGLYHQATWTGISGDRFYKNGPFESFDMVDNPWLIENVIEDHGPLGELYPEAKYIMEGDTPSFLGLIDNGLGWHYSPSYGGWGGRYQLFQTYGETRPIWTNNRTSRDTVSTSDGVTVTSDPATIWRWRRHFQNDFAARMDRCVSRRFEDVNHNPVAVVNGDESKRVVRIAAKPEQTIELSSSGSRDPDDDQLSIRWYVYPEAGSYPGTVQLKNDKRPTATIQVPKDARGKQTIHIILEIEDDGTPPLVAYRRVIIDVVQ
ncbi:nucleoside hydrolase-like domain-containing protein [Crateriforma spongiae]|uniref:nucleoside hydrolase-like domain-containing protein n=1 Tax=Crateriforma spongiae TaxID=2724528 RepID=UPI0039AFDFE0